MTKRLTLYIAIAFAVILSGCQSDYDEPTADPGDALVLSISSAETIISDDNPTRASETNYAQTTLFESGDVVGLTVVADDGETLLANNVPYKFDGENWDVDTDRVPESRRVYFEKSMHTFIVYYPYKKEGNGCKSLEEIKEKCFPHQKDQTKEENYIISDPMAWSDSGSTAWAVFKEGERKLNITLRHLRNSVMLDPKVRWKLSNNDTITYQPLREALEVFTIRNKEGEALKVYHAPDSTYRYILPDNYDGAITWRYAYRLHKFIGSCTVNGGKVGVRYVQDELVDMGDYDTSNALELDCFCKDADNNGYILPWDAVALLRKDKRRCIGVVHYLGHNLRDAVNYSETPVASEKCRGYVLALTDTHPDDYGFEWDKNISVKRKEYVGTNRRPGLDQVNRDWTGLANCQAIKSYAKGLELTLSDFPAENSCLNYGSDWQEGLGVPSNTTEWFLPSDGILHHYLSYDLEKLGATDREALINKRFEYIKMHTDDTYPYHQYIRPLTSVKPYVSSTEIDNGNKGGTRARFVFGLNLADRSAQGDYVWKNEHSSVRPVLVF